MSEVRPRFNLYLCVHPLLFSSSGTSIFPSLPPSPAIRCALFFHPPPPPPPTALSLHFDRCRLLISRFQIPRERGFHLDRHPFGLRRFISGVGGGRGVAPLNGTALRANGLNIETNVGGGRGGSVICSSKKHSLSIKKSRGNFFV